jgi:hypothetical protein
LNCPGKANGPATGSCRDGTIAVWGIVVSIDG